MKKFVRIVCLIFLGSTIAIATGEEQDLGALAKKEKARREALAKQGVKTKTFTNADIPDLKATLAIESTSPPPEQGATEAPPSAGASATRAVEADQEAISENEAKIDELKKEKEDLKEQAQEAIDNVDRGGVLFTPWLGSQYEEQRQANEKAAEIDKEIEKLQKETKEAEEKEEQE